LFKNKTIGWIGKKAPTKKLELALRKEKKKKKIELIFTNFKTEVI